jgi:general secretion pathway protein D
MTSPPDRPVFHMFLRWAGTACLVVLLAGCASWHAHRADKLIEEGKTVEGLAAYQSLANERPKYLARYVAARDRQIRRLLDEADKAQQANDAATALARYNEVFAINPRQDEARRGVELLARADRHNTLLTSAKAEAARGNSDAALQSLNRLMAEAPDFAPALSLRQSLQIERNRTQLGEPALKESLRKPVSLEFKNVSVQAVFEVLAQSSGINFIFDKDVRSDLRTTIYARNTSVEDALRLVMGNSQLAMKVLNDSTVMIYPATAEKLKQFEEMVTRSFYLGSAEPKRVQELVKTMASPRAMFVDEDMRLLVVRDRMEIIESVERLIAAVDIAPPEVLLEVQVMEVGTDALLNLGIEYPDSISASVYGSTNKAGELTINDLENLDRGDFRLFVPDPFAILNLKQGGGSANTLANPRIRVLNHGKAKVLIGDKVPVVTITNTQGSTSESVNYLDVGLKLEVEPEVHVNNDVSIKVSLEVSNIAKEVKTSTGLLTYQIGTRNASTELRLRDGETQVLAGLIRDEERTSASHIPGLGKLPLIGRLFSNTSDTRAKSEIVLLITPRVVRSLHTPAADTIEFTSGTESNPGAKPMRLTPAGKYSTRKLPPEETPAKTVPATTAPAEAQPAVKEIPVVEGNKTAPAEPDTTQETIEEGDEAGPEPTANVDPSMAQLRFDLVAPAQIRSGQELTLAVMASGQPFEAATLDFAIDPAAFAFVRVRPVGAQDVQAQTGASGIRLQVSEGNASGPVAMLTLRALSPGSSPQSIAVGSAKATRTGGAELLVARPAPRQIYITP